MKGACSEVGAGFFSGDKWWDTRNLRPCQINQTRLRLNIRINFFMGSVVLHWNRLPWEVEEFPSLEIFKRYGCGTNWSGAVMGLSRLLGLVKLKVFSNLFQPRWFHVPETTSAEFAQPSKRRLMLKPLCSHRVLWGKEGSAWNVKSSMTVGRRATVYKLSRD